MKVQKIKISNILGLETLEFAPGRVTIVSGRNGAGKSSVLEALKYALTGGTDATIKRKGTEKGEVVIELDEATVTRPTDKAAEITVAGVGPIRRVAEFLRSRIDSLSFNPVQFLLAPKDKRTEWFLEMVPVEVGDDELRAAGVETLPPPARNGLDRIAAATKLVYDARTGVNRALKEKRAAVAQLAEGVVEAPEIDLATMQAARDEKVREIADVEQAAAFERQEAVKVITSERDEKIETIRQTAEARLAELRDEIRRTEAVRDADVQAEKDRAAALVGAAKEAEQTAVRLATDRLRGELEAATAQLAAGQEKAKLAAQTAKTRELIARMTTESAALEGEAGRYSATLDNLDALKVRALDRLPIKDVEIRDGEILVGGIPFDRVNTAARVQFVLNVAMLRKGSLPLVLLDGLECLDPETFEAFVKAAASCDAQFICTRVTEGPLEVNVAA